MKEELNHSHSATVTSRCFPNGIHIYINDKLHLKINTHDILLVQSWYESDCDFKIELVFKDNTALIEYNSFEKWTKVLQILDKYL